MVANASVAAAAFLDAAGVRPPAPQVPTPTPRRRAAGRAGAGDAVAGQAAARSQTADGRAGAEPPAKTLEELLAELDGLTGLDGVKREVHRQAQLLRVEKLRTDGRPAQPRTSPGTWSSSATPAPARPRSRGSSPASTGRSACSPRGSSSRSTAPSWSPATSARPRSRPPRWSWGAPSAACCSSTRRTASPATSTATRPSTPWSRRWRTTATTSSSIVAGYPAPMDDLPHRQPRPVQPVPDDDRPSPTTPTTSSSQILVRLATDADYDADARVPRPVPRDPRHHPAGRGLRERTLRAERLGSCDRSSRVAPAGRRRAHPRAAARAAARGPRGRRPEEAPPRDDPVAPETGDVP